MQCVLSEADDDDELQLMSCDDSSVFLAFQLVPRLLLNPKNEMIRHETANGRSSSQAGQRSLLEAPAQTEMKGP